MSLYVSDQFPVYKYGFKKKFNYIFDMLLHVYFFLAIMYLENADVASVYWIYFLMTQSDSPWRLVKNG